MTVKELFQKTDLAETQHEGRDEEQMNCIMAVLGADLKSFRREKGKAVKRSVSEMHSPRRVTHILRHMSNHNLTPGLASPRSTLVVVSHGASQSRPSERRGSR